MKTPVCDFLREYGESGTVRMHMPGHKGKPETGCDACDLTEIEGADELYRSRGILRESEENAASLFGTGRTVYSAEGSSLCIRAMLYLASLRAAEEKLPRRILAGRNAHKTLMTAAALLDIEIDWVYPEPEEGLLSCGITAEKISESLNKKAYLAVYVTTPDYLGHTVPVQGIAEACRRKGVPLLADNAHGAYLRFLAEDRHPVSEGADLCCDSAHKTLPCLTGAAYLHISKRAPESFARNAERAMSLFASTSPSYLILQSLDRANAMLAGTLPGKIRRAADRTSGLRAALEKRGWKTTGDEAMKLTLCPKTYGYTGTELAGLLRTEGIECEYADPDHTVLMPSTETGEEEWERVRTALEKIPRLEALPEDLPRMNPPEKVLGIRQAMLSPMDVIPAEQAAGRIMADPCIGCPPAVPAVAAGERIGEDAVRVFRYYGIRECAVVREG